jgi:hypothetical protein
MLVFEIKNATFAVLFLKVYLQTNFGPKARRVDVQMGTLQINYGTSCRI